MLNSIRLLFTDFIIGFAFPEFIFRAFRVHLFFFFSFFSSDSLFA